MPDATKTGAGVVHKKAEPEPSGAVSFKEHEPVGEAESIGKIAEIAKEADMAAEAKVIEAIGDEARLAQKEPELGPDLVDHGVKSPQNDASEVLKSGSTIQLPITEKEYRQAEKAKINAHTDDKNNVLGIGSVVALAAWIGRILKMAHGHATRFIFKRGGAD